MSIIKNFLWTHKFLRLLIQFSNELQSTFWHCEKVAINTINYVSFIKGVLLSLRLLEKLDFKVH